MSYWTRLAITEPDETWDGMLKSADERYWDGLTLATDQAARAGGAIYLLGYVAEMLLKTAYFRFQRVSPKDDLFQSGAMAAARQYGTFAGKNLHSLSSWLDLLILIRKQQNRPLDAITGGLATYHVQVIEQNWNEQLRYRFSPALETELQAVVQSVEWLRGNYVLLWS